MAAPVAGGRSRAKWKFGCVPIGHPNFFRGQAILTKVLQAVHVEGCKHEPTRRIRRPNMIAIRKALLGIAATASVAAGIVPASATVAVTPQTALAAPVAHDGWDGGWNHGRDDWRGRDNWRGGGYGRGYNDYRSDYRGYNDGYYGQTAYRGQAWRGNDGRYSCRRNNGTTGLLVGGVAGALLGQGVAGRGDRTLGAILGAAGGALLGKSIDQSSARCR